MELEIDKQIQQHKREIKSQWNVDKQGFEEQKANKAKLNVTANSQIIQNQSVKRKLQHQKQQLKQQLQNYHKYEQRLQQELKQERLSLSLINSNVIQKSVGVNSQLGFDKGSNAKKKVNFKDDVIEIEPPEIHTFENIDNIKKFTRSKLILQIKQIETDKIEREAQELKREKETEEWEKTKNKPFVPSTDRLTAEQVIQMFGKNIIMNEWLCARMTKSERKRLNEIKIKQIQENQNNKASEEWNVALAKTNVKTHVKNGAREDGKEDDESEEEFYYNSNKIDKIDDDKVVAIKLSDDKIDDIKSKPADIKIVYDNNKLAKDKLARDKLARDKLAKDKLFEKTFPESKDDKISENNNKFVDQVKGKTKLIGAKVVDKEIVGQSFHESKEDLKFDDEKEQLITETMNFWMERNNRKIVDNNDDVNDNINDNVNDNVNDKISKKTLKIGLKNIKFTVRNLPTKMRKPQIEFN